MPRVLYTLEFQITVWYMQLACVAWRFKLFSERECLSPRLLSTLGFVIAVSPLKNRQATQANMQWENLCYQKPIQVWEKLETIGTSMLSFSLERDSTIQ